MRDAARMVQTGSSYLVNITVLELGDANNR